MDALSIGIQFVIIIFLFLGIGYWLDSKINTFPIFLIVFVFIGFGIALYTIVKATEQKNDKKN